MAPKYTSTPIRYAGSGSGEKKMTIKKEAGADLDQAGKLKNRHITSNEAKERSSSSASSSKKEVLKHSTQHVSVKKERVSEKPREQGLLKSKTKSVNEDLAEKRKRLMQKLRNDEDDIIAEKAMKQEKKGKSFCFTTSDWFRSTIFGYLAKKTHTMYLFANQTGFFASYCTIFWYCNEIVLRRSLLYFQFYQTSRSEKIEK